MKVSHILTGKLGLIISQAKDIGYGQMAVAVLWEDGFVSMPLIEQIERK